MPVNTTIFFIYPYIFYFLLFFFIVTWRRREVTFCTHKKSGLLFILHLVITCIDENEWYLPQIEHRTCSSMSKWGNILTAFWILSNFLQPVRFCTYKIVIKINVTFIEIREDAPCHSRCGTLKNPHCSMAMSAKFRTKFGEISPVMMTSPYELDEEDVKAQIL